MKWKSLLSQHRDDAVARKAIIKSQHVNTDSQPRRSSFADMYDETRAIEGQLDGRHVFLAARKSDNHSVAVKRFARRRHTEPEIIYKQKIGAEYLIGSQLRHPNIIRMFELFQDLDGQWLQIMEYAPHNLFDRVRSKKMSQGEVDCTFLQIAAGVDYLHQSGFAHRDLKLENIVYTSSGVMKIIDFGTAVTCTKSAGQPNRLSYEYVGSLPYMAPEILERKAYDPQCADVWSLAIMYCCMSKQTFPWKKASFTDPEFAAFAQSMGVTFHVVEEKQPSKTTGGRMKIVMKFATPQEQQARAVVEQRKDSAICMDFDDDEKMDHIETGGSSLPNCLPREVRPVISGMLHLDWQKRSTMRDVMRSDWAKSTKTCAADDEEIVTGITSSCTHQHT